MLRELYVSRIQFLKRFLLFCGFGARCYTVSSTKQELREGNIFIPPVEINLSIHLAIIYNASPLRVRGLESVPADIGRELKHCVVT